MGCTRVVLLVAALSSSVIWAKPTNVKDCDAYAYCDGQNFNATVTLGPRVVRCDTVPAPRDRCCLPQAKHLVCYGIKVDGQDLNYEKDNYAHTTDFTGLCNLMARSAGKKTGKHSSAITAGGGGNLVWRYGEWSNVDIGTEHIKNLACEILR